MHILIAAHGFPPTHSAGAERQAERMAHWLVSNGHQVTVFAVEKLDKAGFRVETSEQDGFTIYRLYYDVKQGDVFHNLYDYPAVGQAFREILSQQRFDLVHLVSGYLLAGQVIHTAHEVGLPVVITLTEYWFMCARLNLIQANGALCSGPETDEKCARCLLEDKRRYRLPAEAAPGLMDAFWGLAHYMPFAAQMTANVAERRETLHTALNAADLVISVSRYLITKFAEYNFDTERYIFLRQGLSTPLNENMTIERHPSDVLRLGYTGQIKVHKGVDLVVDAVISLLDAGHKISLDLWGSETEDPVYTKMLKDRSASYPAIRWNGRYTGSKVWNVLADFDVAVVPSRWYENSPTVILEAYEMKVPVITTNLGGMAELVEHGKSGLVFALNDLDDLTDQIRRLLTEPNLLNHLRANIPPVKTIEEEMHDLLKAYEDLLKIH